MTSAFRLCLLPLALLAACASPPPRVSEPPVSALAARYPASFDCAELETPLQAFICRDAALAEADRRLAPLLIQRLRQQDMAGRAELLADQRQWTLGLYPRCGIGPRPDERSALPAAALACLQQALPARIAALQAWPAPVVATADAGGARHPLATYVEFREAQSLEPALCGDLGNRFNQLLAERGDVDPTRVPGWRLLAGNHGAPQAVLPDGRRAEVELHDAGPYGSYELRAVGLTVDGQRVVDDRTVPAWMLELPNAGGSFSSTSSQTGDYAAIEVVQQGARTLVLVNQTWGYYASAARGESPHAALYELSGGALQRRCLWRTYIAPPVAQALRFVPQFKALQALLDTAAGPMSPRLAPADRRDAGLLYAEQQWQLLNMPLLGIREAERLGRWPLLRQRHDEALEAVLAWSERNVPSKQLYRRLMPLIPVAHAELQKAFAGTEGLKPDDARAAADLLLMSAIAHAAERLQDPAVPRPPVAGAAYAARQAVAPKPGDLERGRPYDGLHSALLNRAKPEVVEDFWRFTWGDSDRVGDPAKGLGPAGDTPLMAAVRSPEWVGRLLAAGADANARNAWGKTALMMAAQADQPDSVQRLLQAGADPKARTTAWQADGAGGLDNGEGEQAGRTALFYAVGSAQAAVIEALIGASDRQALDAGGKTACDLLAGNARLQPADVTRLRAGLCVPP